MKIARLVSALVVFGVSGPSAAWAADGTPPTAPTNLRVTGTTSFSVSLAWNPSTDNSGSFVYRIRHSWGYEATVPQTQTSFTWATNVEPRNTYSFFVYAVDAAGNKSKSSNSVSARLPADTVPPTTPVVSVTDVGPTHVSLAWSAQDNGPFVFYWVHRDGTPIIQGTSSTSAIIPLLTPETTHTFTVRARDNGINWSGTSAPVTATTEASNPDDVTAPTTPANFRGSNYGCEVTLRWSESTDDLDPQWILEYRLFVNGVRDHSVSLRTTRTTVYGTGDGPNEFSIVAVDTAGNESAPARTTEILDSCDQL